MSETEYRSGVATKIDVPDGDWDEKRRFIETLVGFEPDYVDDVVENKHEIPYFAWFDKKSLQEIVFVNNQFYLVKYKNYDDGYIHFARKDQDGIAFVFVYYNGGTWFSNELREAISELEK